MKNVKKSPLILIALGVVGISLSSIFVRYSTAPSAVTAAFRLGWTVLFLSPVVFGKAQNRKELKALPAKTVLLSALSGVFLAIHFVLWFESLYKTSVASSTAIVCTEVIWVCLGFCVFMRGKLSWHAVLAIAVSLAGSMLIAFSDSTEGEQLYGDVLSLLSAVAVAVYTLIGRAVRSKVSTTVYTYIVYCTCGAVLLLVCLVQGGSKLLNLSALIVGLLLALFSTIMGHSIFSWGLKYFSPAFISASKLCEPAVAALIAVPLFGEIPSPIQAVGGVLIVGGVLYYSVSESGKLQKKNRIKPR